MSEGTRQEDNSVMACPHCGRPVLHSCYHCDKGDVRSIEMPVTKAIELMDGYVSFLSDQFEDAKEHRQQLVASMMDWETED